MFESLRKYIDLLDVSTISSSRKNELQKVIDYISLCVSKNEPVKLNFICTHNSRRSHLSQVWAKTLASHFQIDRVKCYSGGTEATAVYKTVIKTLENVGFIITNLGPDSNPTYKLFMNDRDCPMTLFSKTFDDAYNPNTDFGAVMTCNHADQNCPLIPNSTRLSLPYTDPKEHDGTSYEDQGYEDRSLQIATEMKYIFSNIS
ncbi:MAG: protein-tyrosine-phosphatase [Bacteroidia bacterium]